MSRQIDYDKPLSEADKAWLHTMSLDYLIDENDRRFGKDRTKISELPLFADLGEEHQPDGKPVDVKIDDELVKQVLSLDYSDLKEELKLRGIPATGKKEELQQALIKALVEDAKKS